MSRNVLKVTALSQEEIREYLHGDFNYKRGMKLFAVYLISKGWSARSLEELFDISFKQITTWVHEVNARGITGIEEKPKTGRNAKLSAEEKKKLKDIILNFSPSDFNIESKRWKGESVKELIQTKFGVSYKKAQIYNIIKSLNIEYKNGKWIDTLSE